MNASIAIEFMPLDTPDRDELVSAVDRVIEYIASTGVSYYVGPFETAIEADFDTCMDVLKQLHYVAAESGCTDMMSFVKIHFCPEDRGVLTTEQKIAKYHPEDPQFAQEGDKNL